MAGQIGATFSGDTLRVDLNSVVLTALSAWRVPAFSVSLRRPTLARLSTRRIVITDFGFAKLIQRFAERIAVEDGVAFVVGKSVADRVTIADAIGFQLAKGFTLDAAAAVDGIALRHSTGFADTYGATDSHGIAVAKGASDAISLTDSRWLSLQKALSDVIIVVDGVSFSFAQVLADTLSPSEAVSIATSKTFAEAVNVLDHVAVGGASEAQADDFAGATDAASIELATAVSDYVEAIESFALTITLGAGAHSQLNGYPLGEWMLGD